MLITRKHLSRRSVLRGAGVCLALPLLDSMIPAQTPLRRTAAGRKTRLVAIEMVHGAAGSAAGGRAKNYWSPVQAGRNFEFTASLQSLEPLRDYITIVSNTELHNAMSLVPDEDGPMADHARSSAVFLTAAHPKRSDDGDIRSGPSIDQLYAAQVGRETRIASLQLCVENNSMAGGCGHGYSCAYTNTISWASPTTPLRMEASPRAVFERLFGRAPGEKASILDAAPESIASLQRTLGAADRRHVSEYLDTVREVEGRIQKADPGGGQEMPFEEHVRLMFDLQVLAFTADITRVSTFKMGIDRSQRVYPESGVTTPFHALSHHREEPEKLAEFARLNHYHVSQAAWFLQRLRDTADGDGNLLDHSVVLYGSPMGDSHVHEHRYLPLFLAGRASGAVRGNRHVSCAEDTPMANVLLTLMQKLGVGVERIGDSTGLVDL